MSIRNIGQDIYVPSSPGNFARGHTKVIRSTTLPDENQQKKNKVNWYREQLDRQVQELRARKEKEKKKEMQEDLKRERQFYNSLKNVEVKPPINFHQQNRESSRRQSSHRKVVSFSTPESRPINNPQIQPFSHQNYYDNSSSRFAHVGRRKLHNYQSASFSTQQQSGLMGRYDGYPRQIDDQQYSDSKLQMRRRQFNQQIDRNLYDAFRAVDRSRNHTLNIDGQLHKLKIKMKTESDEAYHFDNYQPYRYEDKMYSLPYRTGQSRLRHQNTHAFVGNSRVLYYD